MAIKILCYTDVFHARAKTQLQDVISIKPMCPNFVSQPVPWGGRKFASHKMVFRRTTVAWSASWHKRYRFLQRLERALRCSSFGQLLECRGTDKGFLAVHPTFGKTSLRLAPRCSSLLLVSWLLWMAAPRLPQPAVVLSGGMGSQLLRRLKGIKSLRAQLSPLPSSRRILNRFCVAVTGNSWSLQRVNREP